MVTPRNRPSGIVVIAVLWTLGSIINLYSGFVNIILDLGYLPVLSNPDVAEWYRFALPADLVLEFFVVALAFFALYTVYGLWTAKSWSYIAAYFIPAFAGITTLVLTALYLSISAEVDVGSEISLRVIVFVFDLVWMIVVWNYLTKLYVKQYFNQIPSPSPVRVPPPPPPSVVTPEEKKFCRYCGTENNADAIFCMKCGKKIG